MKKIINIISQPIRKFWFSEFQISGKPFYYGTVVAALFIVGIASFAIYYFGAIGAIVLFLQQTLRLVIATIAKLTIKALLLLGLKRFLIDFLVMPVMQRSVIKHLVPALISRLKDSRSRILRWVGVTFAGVSAIAIAVFAFLSNGLSLIQSVLMFVGGKLAASFGFKTVWTLIASSWALLVKYWAVIKTTPLGILIQVYILSKLTDLLVKLIPERALLRLRPLKDWFIKFFWDVHSFIDDIFGFKLEETVKSIAAWIEPVEARKQRNHERFLLALQRKKQKIEEKQKQNLPQNEGARISGFDARRARKHRPNRNQHRLRWYTARFTTLKWSLPSGWAIFLSFKSSHISNPNCICCIIWFWYFWQLKYHLNSFLKLSFFCGSRTCDSFFYL